MCGAGKNDESECVGCLLFLISNHPAQNQQRISAQVSGFDRVEGAVRGRVSRFELLIVTDTRGLL